MVELINLVNWSRVEIYQGVEMIKGRSGKGMKLMKGLNWSRVEINHGVELIKGRSGKGNETDQRVELVKG